MTIIPEHTFTIVSKRATHDGASHPTSPREHEKQRAFALFIVSIDPRRVVVSSS